MGPLVTFMISTAIPTNPLISSGRRLSSPSVARCFWSDCRKILVTMLLAITFNSAHLVNDCSLGASTHSTQTPTNLSPGEEGPALLVLAASLSLKLCD